MRLVKLLVLALGVIFLAEGAPRLLIHSDLERFVDVEGPAIQYAGMAQSLLNREACTRGLATLICTGIRISEVRLANPGSGEAGLSVPPGCLFPYDGTAQIHSLFGIPVRTVNIDCNLGFSQASN